MTIYLKEVNINAVRQWKKQELFNQFVLNWLRESGIDTDRLTDSDYNQDVVLSISNTWIGGDDRDIDYYGEFKDKAIDYLSELIPYVEDGYAEDDYVQ